MSLLQYTSNEMFSSTELIRKSKTIFDKLNDNEIEKAVILRDGKPSFMLMDFYKYEELINEYLKLKDMIKNSGTKNESSNVTKIVKNVSHETIVENKAQKEEIKKEQINKSDLEKALAAIDNLDFNLTTTKVNDDKKKEELKDFWE